MHVCMYWICNYALRERILTKSKAKHQKKATMYNYIFMKSNGDLLTRADHSDDMIITTDVAQMPKYTTSLGGMYDKHLKKKKKDIKV